MVLVHQGANLGIGLYSLAEAARLLRTPRRTLSRWVEGYVQELRGGEKQYAPVLAEKEDTSVLSFGDLVELMYVRGFRDVGVRLDEIRDAAAKFRTEWTVPFPLATKRFATDGRSLLIKKGDAWEHALSGQQSAFFEELGNQLVHIGDLATEWRPLGKGRHVVLDPGRAFGKPIDDTSGVRTEVLAQSLRAEGDVKALAWWYDTSVDSIVDAVEFEKGWRSCRERSRAAA